MSDSTERYRAWRAAGLCGKCGAETPIGPRGKAMSRCERHLVSARDAAARRIEEHRAMGLCVVCSLPHEPGYVTCATHRDAAADRTIAWREAQAERGECARCIRPREPGHILCAEHVEIDRGEGEVEHDVKVERDAERRQHYRDLGLCPLCGDERGPGTVLCARHAEIARVDQSKHRQRLRRRSLAEVVPGVVRRRRGNG